MPKRRHTRGVDATGRSIKSEPFVRIPKSELRTPAWAALSCTARALYVEVRALYYGQNNGRLFLSHDDASALLGVSPDTATRAFWELCEKGFLEVVRRGAFSMKIKHATVWRLTSETTERRPASHEFRAWRPKRAVVAPSRDTPRAQAIAAAKERRAQREIKIVEKAMEVRTRLACRTLESESRSKNLEPTDHFPGISVQKNRTDNPKSSDRQAPKTTFHGPKISDASINHGGQGEETEKPQALIIAFPASEKLVSPHDLIDEGDLDPTIDWSFAEPSA